jgi:hypothetical protein
MRIMYFVAFRQIVRGSQAVVFPIPELRPAHQVSLITVLLRKITTIFAELRSVTNHLIFFLPCFQRYIVLFLKKSFFKKIISHSLEFYYESLKFFPPVFLKVPKCENFHRTDFFYFYTIGTVAGTAPQVRWVHRLTSSLPPPSPRNPRK